MLGHGWIWSELGTAVLSCDADGEVTDFEATLAACYRQVARSFAADHTLLNQAEPRAEAVSELKRLHGFEVADVNGTACVRPVS